MQYKIIVDKQPNTNPSDEKKEYIIDIEELRVKGDVYDSLNIELSRTYVTRRLNLSEYGVLTVLDEPVIEELTEVNIELFEGDNYIYLSDMQGNKFYAEYLIKNDFNDIYATKNEMNSAITQTAEGIELSVNQKLTSYATNEELEEQVTELNSTITQTAGEINLEVSKKVGEDEICSVISQSADEISLKGNRVIIESTNFELDKNGTLNCKNANVSGTITSNNATITGGIINLKPEGALDVFRVIKNNNINTMAYVADDIFGINNNNDHIEIACQDAGAKIDVYRTGTSSTVISYNQITTPKVTQTSLEKIKKNISKFNKNATNIVNESEIYEYNLKSDKDTDKKMIGFVIGDKYKTPVEVTDKDGQSIELYSAIGILWKAVQELSVKVEQLEKEVQRE